MRTKQRITSLLLALVIAFTTIPTSALAVGTSNAAVTKPSFEIAFSVPAFEDTLVFSEKPVRAQWGIGDGPYRIAFVFPIGTKTSLIDNTGQMVEIFAFSESYLGDNIESWEFGDCRTESALEFVLTRDLGFDPNGIRLCDIGMERGLLPVMINDVTEKAIDPGDTIIYTWELDPSVPAPANFKAASDRYLMPSHHIQSNDPDIIALAERITEGLTDDLARARAINRWVAKNIWYDNDSLAVINDPDDRSFRDQNAKFVLDNKLAVCEGYSNLTVALLRAVDIPADTVSGNNNDPVGHIWLRAYVNDRWINMDPTWDSNNEYRNGKFGQQREPSIRWFDVPDDRFNRSHVADTNDLYRLILDEGLAATEIWSNESTEQPNDGIAA